MQFTCCEEVGHKTLSLGLEVCQELEIYLTGYQDRVESESDRDRGIETAFVCFRMLFLA